eukprot:6818313-Prymnesium_polylepis.2
MVDSDGEAMRVVSMSVTKEHNHNALEIAMRSNAKKFLCHRGVEGLSATRSSHSSHCDLPPLASPALMNVA